MLVVPDAALTWRFVRAGGPGGQHVNKVATGVELECAVRECGFAADVTERIIGILGDVVRLTVTETRSQRRNRELARERLEAMVRAAAIPPKRRRATRPTRAGVQRRLDAKRRNSAVKRSRAAREDG